MNSKDLLKAYSLWGLRGPRIRWDHELVEPLLDSGMPAWAPQPAAPGPLQAAREDQLLSLQKVPAVLANMAHRLLKNGKGRRQKA